jgi:hypothetical protein
MTGAGMDASMAEKLPAGRVLTVGLLMFAARVVDISRAWGPSHMCSGLVVWFPGLLHRPFFREGTCRSGFLTLCRCFLPGSPVHRRCARSVARLFCSCLRAISRRAPSRSDTHPRGDRQSVDRVAGQAASPIQLTRRTNCFCPPKACSILKSASQNDYM